jgi:hypothetical protein
MTQDETPGTVKCPRCGAVAEPVFSDETAVPETADRGSERWSFVWTAPRGDFCPECDFPLSKYVGRLKWVRTMSVGVAIVVVGFLLQIIGVLRVAGSAYVRVMQAIVLTGAIVFVIGAVGVIVGGKHGRVRTAGRL